MMLADPVPFAEALQARQVKTLLRTTGTSADFERLARMEPAVLERATFSATLEIARALDTIERGTQAMLAGKLDQATFRLELKKVFEEVGYTAAPEIAGTLQDFRTDRRLNLIVETNVELARGYGQWAQGQQADVLDEWPAQELVRVRTAEKPRDWEQRWIDAGGIFREESGNRMIALKNDPIWSKLSRFNLPYPPFDYNSGMDVRDVARDEAEALGLLDAGTVVMPQDRDFNADLQAAPAVRSNWLIEGLEATGVGEFRDDGVFVFTPGGAP